MKTIHIEPAVSPLSAEITIQGSKSYTNRALILGALTEGPVILERPLISDDTRALISCLTELGIKVIEMEDTIEVFGSVTDITEGEYALNAKLSGTTIRFMLALLSVVPGVKTITGDAGLNKRPIKDL